MASRLRHVSTAVPQPCDLHARYSAFSCFPAADAQAQVFVAQQECAAPDAAGCACFRASRQAKAPCRRRQCRFILMPRHFDFADCFFISIFDADARFARAFTRVRRAPSAVALRARKRKTLDAHMPHI